MINDTITCPITVERRHIQQGIPTYPGDCPLALAITEQTGMKVRVTEFSVRTKTRRETLIAWLPPNAKVFVKHLDANGRDAVEPFTFPIEANRRVYLRANPSSKTRTTP